MFSYFGLNYNFNDRKIWYPSCTRAVGSWPEEIEKSAALVANRAKKDIVICMSGGVDSEIVATTFKKLGIPFKILIMKFENNYNAHDISWSRKWAENNSVPYEIVDFNIQNFMTTGYKKYLKEGLVSNNIFRYFVIEMLKIIEDKNGFGILGGKSVGLSLLQHKLDDYTVYDQYDIGSLAPIEWIRRNDVDHCVFFYQSTPEIHKAYLNDPVNQFIINNPMYLRSMGSNEAFKTVMIRGLFPHMASRPKYHGFEKIYELRWQCQAEMAKYFELDTEVENKRFKYVYYNNMISINIDDVKKQLK